MIPPLTTHGLPPPGIHEADSWEEIVNCFGGTPERRELLDKFYRGLENLRSAGCARVLLDGSFVTDKPNPADVDGCWDDAASIDFQRLDACFLLGSRADRISLRSRYGMDFFPASAIEAGSGKPFLLFFQSDREDHPRGIVRLYLREEPRPPRVEAGEERLPDDRQ